MLTDLQCLQNTQASKRRTSGGPQGSLLERDEGATMERQKAIAPAQRVLNPLLFETKVRQSACGSRTFQTIFCSDFIASPPAQSGPLLS